MSKKKVEVFQVIIKTRGDIPAPQFEDILMNTEFHDKTVHGFAKRIQMSYLEDKGDYIVGIIETTQMGATPPKYNTVTKERNSLGLDTPEGLLYGNVFLYDKTTKVFIYEVTKNGTFIGQLDDFFYKLTKDSDLPKYTIRFSMVMNVDAMEKMLRMGNKRMLHLQFANPAGLVKKIKNEQSSLKQLAKNGADVGAEVIDVTYKMEGRKKNSLHTGKVDQILNYLKEKSELALEHFQHIKVKGYDEDTENVTEIDLIRDKMIDYISYTEDRNMTDIRPHERKVEITEAYNRKIRDLKKYFLDDDRQT
ncbi:DUF6731 family protein [Sphingobacterium zeae]|jgi:hypothetical protein|uniref:DUF6731 family protein n=1 Tax=Sphingobacterium zeae TaxID=1776859 RepID=UPI00361AABCA